MNHQNLFSEFEPVSSKQWKQQIQVELRGADYSELVWQSPEDIKVKPFYHNDEFEGVATRQTGSTFKVCQDIFVKDVEKSVWRANDSIRRGADALRLTIADDTIDLTALLHGIQQPVRLILVLPFQNESVLKKIDILSAGKEVFVICDPIHQLASDGNWFEGNADNFALMAKSNFHNIHSVSVDATLYQNAGADLVQQIAYALGHANEYFARMTVKGPMLFQVAMGSNYFFEIAKLRALRELFHLMAAEYGHTDGCHILAMPSRRNKTIYDYNVNMLRTTTECMSAILGGADTVMNLPYDVLYHKSNEFGERISRNQLLVLKHESYFDRVSNPAEGSYYIEALTSQLAQKALTLLKNIEANGGFLHQLKEGTIQRKIAEKAKIEQDAFDSGEQVLVGTNKYPNKNDRMRDDLELYPFVKQQPRKTLITPIIPRRLAEKLEQERLNLES